MMITAIFVNLPDSDLYNQPSGVSIYFGMGGSFKVFIRQREWGKEIKAKSEQSRFSG